MAIAPDFLDEIRARIGLGDIIARHVPLKRAGRELTGLCPFHSEKTPSFTISEEKGFFHCFGCGAHGDVIGFVMRQEGLSFPEAVERLAGEAGLQVPKATPEEREAAKRAASLHEVMERACRFFEAELQGPRGAAARSYLDGRGIDEATIARFRLGYAPDTRTALRNAVMDAEHPEALLVEAGLLIRPDDGTPYDRFRGRVIFPITDRRGRVIAFGGRILSEGNPKYLNSPDTPLFSKGRVLYGMATAREAAHRNGRVIVTEGYTDVIALNRAGYSEAVAPLGTRADRKPSARAVADGARTHSLFRRRSRRKARRLPGGRAGVAAAGTRTLAPVRYPAGGPGSRQPARRRGNKGRRRLFGRKARPC